MHPGLSLSPQALSFSWLNSLGLKIQISYRRVPICVACLRPKDRQAGTEGCREKEGTMDSRTLDRGFLGVLSVPGGWSNQIGAYYHPPSGEISLSRNDD